MRPLSPLTFRVFVVLDIGVFTVVGDRPDARVDAFGFYAGDADRVRSSCRKNKKKKSRSINFVHTGAMLSFPSPARPVRQRQRIAESFSAKKERCTLITLF